MASRSSLALAAALTSGLVQPPASFTIQYFEEDAARKIRERTGKHAE